MESFVLSLFILIGVIGTLIPSIPGTSIILLGALTHALMTNFHPISIGNLLVLMALSILGAMGQYVLTGFGAKKFGATKYGIIGACVGSVAGFIFPVPGGLFLGAFLGAFIFEIFFSMKDIREGIKAGTGAFVGTVVSLFFEFGIALIMALLIAYWVVWA